MDHHQFHLWTTIRAYFVTYGHSCSRFLWIHIYMYKNFFLFQITVFKSWKWLFMVCLMSCDNARSGFVLNTINERSSYDPIQIEGILLCQHVFTLAIMLVPLNLRIKLGNEICHDQETNDLYTRWVLNLISFCLT